MHAQVFVSKLSAGKAYTIVRYVGTGTLPTDALAGTYSCCEFLK